MKKIIAVSNATSVDVVEKTTRIIPRGTVGVVIARGTGWTQVRWRLMGGDRVQKVNTGELKQFTAAVDGDPDPRPFSTDPRIEPEQQDGKDHPWIEFDSWHAAYHEGMGIAPIAWPCSQPLRCLWRFTQESGAMLDQYGVVNTPSWRRRRSNNLLPTIFTVGGKRRKRSL